MYVIKQSMNYKHFSQDNKMISIRKNIDFKIKFQKKFKIIIYKIYPWILTRFAL